MKINYFVRTECHLTKSIVSFSLKGSDVILIWNEKYIERTVTWGKKLMSSGIHLWYRFWTANLLTLSSIINETVHYLELEWEINSSLSKMEFSQPLQSSTAAPMEHTHTHTHTQRTRQKCSPCPIHQGSTTLPCPIRSRSADLILHPLD